MKVKNIILIGVASFLALTSCGDFDFREYRNYDEAYMKSDFSTVGALLTQIYLTVDTDWGSFGGGLFASACDESECPYTSVSVNNFYDGSWSPTNALSSNWSNCYEGIANCNIFLSTFTGMTFDDLYQNDDYFVQMRRYNNYPYEVRFMRAYFYFVLARQYGAVPMVPQDEVWNADYTTDLKRTPVQEVFDYIISECAAIQDSICEDYTTVGISPVESGRVDKAGVLALKARTAMYAASPLFNTDNDNSLWTRAANYTKELLDYCENEKGMSLVADYSSLWAVNCHINSTTIRELIFCRRANSTASSMENYNYPCGITHSSGNGGYNCPTQTLVDAYDMVETGEPYDGGWGPNDDPYSGRDPRFEMSIAHNGTTAWPTWNTDTLKTYQNGANGEPNTGGTPTSYYMKKYLHGAIDFNSASSYTADYHTWLTFRLAEFYLNYAECLYHVTGSPYAAYNGDYANEMVNKTRTRAGMPEISSNLSNDEWWEKYERERMVELAFEEQRFWDLRRWKEGEKCVKFDRMKITTDDGGVTFNYTRESVTRCAWDDKFYLFPIPRTEIMKNPNLEQNPGW